MEKNIWSKQLLENLLFTFICKHIYIYLYLCIICVYHMWIKCTLKKKSSFLPLPPRQTDFSFPSCNMIKQVFCKVFPWYLQTVILIWWFSLQSKLQYMVFYCGSNGTTFKLLILLFKTDNFFFPFLQKFFILAKSPLNIHSFLLKKKKRIKIWKYCCSPLEFHIARPVTFYHL